ncbi:Prolyl-tRNA deacylase proX [Neisseria animaloris]|uniref:prolyl-tRNA synthetase associated domain-containing protein n=1 Tax=Neisseria animaloris TaxID=326522 RepID=UPI000A19122A|nr:prolyl-tRNA synthetase associated domain-containing protein [Neisseria animaloris]OSI07076.1 prolyl-tRNA editing protein [Neisseria animaloris]VEH88190.1 Prolyl-tRNA deacylase proX [Neisseria animaloris]
MGALSDHVFKSLKEMGIDYDVAQHPPALTTEEADRFIEGKEGVRTKTLFLTNRKKTAFYLVVTDDAKRLDMEKLTDLLQENRLSFGSAERLKEKMGLEPGVVSLFGLLNNKDHDINVYLDKEILSQERITFHGNENTNTVFIKMEDVYRFLNHLSYDYQIIDL